MLLGKKREYLTFKRRGSDELSEEIQGTAFADVFQLRSQEQESLGAVVGRATHRVRMSYTSAFTIKIQDFADNQWGNRYHVLSLPENLNRNNHQLTFIVEERQRE